jgi:2'-5' RNA ligase
MTTASDRFFIALLPPLEIQTQVTHWKEYCRDRYHTAAALRSPPHITLMPPFAWATDDTERLLTTLAQFPAPLTRLPITLSGFGAFPPRVIFVHVVPSPQLTRLQADLQAYLTNQLGLEPGQSRDRPFHPHMTIAFRDLSRTAFRPAWAEFEQKSFQKGFTVTTFTLLKHTGKAWEVHSHYPLQ